MHGQYRLDRTFTECLSTKNYRPVVILKRAGHNLGRRSRTPVHQHYHRGTAQVVFWRRVESDSRILCTSARRHDHPLAKKNIADINCAFQNTPWIITQIEDQTI